MRPVLIIPISLLAGLIVASWFTPAEAPVPDAQALATAEPALAAMQAYLMPPGTSGSAPVRDTLVPDPVLNAAAAGVYHVESGTMLWSRNAGTRLPIASIAKILNAMAVSEALHSDEVVTVGSASVRVDGTRGTLYAGERLRVSDLTALMLIESSNDAAYALAAHAASEGMDLVALMNRQAWLLDMASSSFTDPAGLDDRAYSTVSDLVRLARTALRTAPQLWPVMGTKELDIASVDGSFLHHAVNTNELIGVLPGLVGGKTGNTDGALGCLLVVVKSPDGRDTLVSIVLGSKQRFTDTQTLVEWAWQAYRWR